MLDITPIMVAAVGTVGSVLAVWLPLRWGKQAGRDTNARPHVAPPSSAIAGFENCTDAIKGLGRDMHDRFDRLDRLARGARCPFEDMPNAPPYTNPAGLPPSSNT